MRETLNDLILIYQIIVDEMQFCNNAKLENCPHTVFSFQGMVNLQVKASLVEEGQMCISENFTQFYLYMYRGLNVHQFNHLHMNKSYHYVNCY